MSRVAIMTDSNSGINQKEAKELGITVLPMPFTIDDVDYLEDITLGQEAFYEKLLNECKISTSQPSPEMVTDAWDELLKNYDEVVHIPMSSGLSGSCQTAIMLAEDYNGKVQVVNNQRISVTQRSSVDDAVKLAEAGLNAEKIKKCLEADKFESSIYIMLDTLTYLKNGGRLTPAVATIGTLLKIKPVLQIQGDKLDAFTVARTSSQGKVAMMNQIEKDIVKRFGGTETGKGVTLFIAYTYNKDVAEQYKKEVSERFPDAEIRYMDPLSLSVSCHIGPGALALAVARKSF